MRVIGAHWSVSLHEKGTAKKQREEQIKQWELKKKNENFKKRVKSGQVEESIRKWIDKKYDDLYVEHSRSFVKSESFYIVRGGEKILKLSLHNTIFQEIQHGTPFVDLNEFTSTNTLKKYLEKKISEVSN